MSRWPNWRRWQWLAAPLITLSLQSPTPALEAPVLGEGWLAGPGAVGGNTYSGVIDAPGIDVRMTVAGVVQIAGWFVDRTADGWAGADDIEIYLGTMGNGGTLLTHAFFARDRPDVAASFGRPDWAASGGSASVPTSARVPGNNPVSVYAHSPAKGGWYRQQTLYVSANATMRAAPPAVGFDISYPQCGGPEPTPPAFAVVGIYGGRAFTSNACVARQYVWALTATSAVQPRVAFYMNTGNPGPEASRRWPPAGTSTPQPCDGSWTGACAYDYGWLAAQDAYTRARSVAGDGAAVSPWWWTSRRPTVGLSRSPPMPLICRARSTTCGRSTWAASVSMPWRSIGKTSLVPHRPTRRRTRPSRRSQTGAQVRETAPTPSIGVPARSPVDGSHTSSTPPMGSMRTWLAPERHTLALHRQPRVRDMITRELIHGD